MPRVKQREEVVAGEEVGLVCRACGCQRFRVVYLKRRPNGVVMRLRECRHCGRRITTREAASAQGDRFGIPNPVPSHRPGSLTSAPTGRPRD